MTTSPDCEHGFHGVLIAHAPIESGDTVEIDFVCTACGSIEYTHYYARKDWQRELAHRAEQNARRREAR